MYQDNTLNLITRKEATRILRISESTLDRWSNEQLVRKYKIKGRVFYKSNELSKLVSDN